MNIPIGKHNLATVITCPMYNKLVALGFAQYVVPLLKANEYRGFKK